MACPVSFHRFLSSVPHLLSPLLDNLEHLCYTYHCNPFIRLQSVDTYAL